MITDKGPLPLVRLFTRDPNLLSSLSTNGITIGSSTFKVEESRSLARSFPCRNCLQYHPGERSIKPPHCYKCEKSHTSYSCKILPNKNYSATCRLQGHRTAAANCPLCSLQNQTFQFNKVYRSAKSNTTHSNISNNNQNISVQKKKYMTENLFKETLLRFHEHT